MAVPVAEDPDARPAEDPGLSPGACGPPAGVPPPGLRALVAGLGTASLAVYLAGLPRVTGRGPETHVAYVAFHVVLVLLYLAALAVLLRRPTADRQVVGLVLAFGLLFRLAVLPSPVFLSSDVYRYLWDGRVQRAGVNPYRYPPAADELAFLRDGVIHAGINRPSEPTVYPPLAQLLFRLSATVAPDSLRGWRLLVLGGEAATVALLLRLLNRMGRSPSAVVVYAWAPLAVMESAQGGHVDFLMLPLLLLALLWRQRGPTFRAGVALGAAVLVKLYPAVLAVVWARGGGPAFPLGVLAALGLGYAVYAGGVGPGVLGFLPRYFGTAEDFNIGLRRFVTDALAAALGRGGLAALGDTALRVLMALGGLEPGWRVEALLGPEQAAALRAHLGLPEADARTLLRVQAGQEALRAVVMLGLFGTLLGVLRRLGRWPEERPEGVFRAGMAAVAAYLLLVPTAMHAWYAAWILPFLTVAPSPAWLWFTGTVSLSYLKYAWPPAPDLPLWVRAVEYGPLCLLLAWEWRRHGVWPPLPGSRRGSRPVVDRRARDA